MKYYIIIFLSASVLPLIIGINDRDSIKISKQSGLTSVEYAIVAGLISMGVVGGFSDMGRNSAKLVDGLAVSMAQTPTHSDNSDSGNSGSGGSDSSDSGNSGSGSSDSVSGR